MSTRSRLIEGQTMASSTHLNPSVVDGQTSQMTGDAQLAKTVGKQLSTGARVKVPAHSTLGRWIDVLKSTVHSSATRRLESIAGGAVDEIRVNTRTGEVTHYFNARIQSPPVALTDLLGGREIKNALLNLASVLAPNAELRIPAFYQGGTVALTDVQKFYGEPQHLMPEQATARAKELANNPVFKGQDALPDHSLMEQVQQAVGDSDTFYNMLAAIRAVLAAPGPDFDLALQQVEVAPYSQHWSQERRQPVTVSLKQLILDNGWFVPENKDELFNLGLALGAQTFSSESKKSAGGLLTKDVSMSAPDQATVTQVVETWIAQQKKQQPEKRGSARSLIEYLSRSIPESNNPEVFLKSLINSPGAQALGKRIQMAIDAMPTATSSEEALMTALLLDADINAGQQRNNLAGYNLRQHANWGCSPTEVVNRFEKHLDGRFGASLAKVVAFQLLSVCAPEFLVKDIPPSLVYGSHSWALFSAAVSRRELTAVGSTAGETYQTIMELDSIAPITDSAQRQAQVALMRSVIDWAIVQGVIQENAGDEYTVDEVERSVAAMNVQVNSMVEAVELLAAPVPARKELALAELKRVYGSENEHFFEEGLFSKEKTGNRLFYSLVDIYMSGDLHAHPWNSTSAEFSAEKVASRLSELRDINKAFDEAFDVYTAQLTKMFKDVFSYQFSLLSLEDRRLLERGKVTTFSLEAPAGDKSVMAGHKIADYIATGAMLIRAESEGKVVHYLYSPAQGKIVKDADPSRPGLQFPNTHLYFTMPQPGSSGETERTIDIHWQLADEPALGVTARRIYPSKSLESVVPGLFVGPVPSVRSPKLSELSTIAGAYFTRGLESVKKTAKGQTPQERSIAFHAAVREFFLNLVPFYSTVKSFINGRVGEGFVNLVMDVFGFFIPATRGGAQAVRVGAKGLGSLLRFTKGFAVTGVQAANPLANVFDVSRGVFKLSGKGIKQLSRLRASSLDKLRSIHGPRSGSFTPSKLGNRENIAQGVYRKVDGHSEWVPAEAVQRNGKWYAFDAHTRTAYGAPLKEFDPRPSFNVTQQLVVPAVGVVIDSGFSVANMALNKHLYHRSLPSMTHQASAPLTGLPETEDIAPAAQVRVGSALHLRFEVAKSNTVNIEKHSLEYSAGGTVLNHVPRQVWSEDPLQLLDQLEAEVSLVEERSETDAQMHEVFFKPYHFYGAVDQGPEGMEKRLEVIEKKIAAVRKVQATLYKLLNPDAP
ncbi:MULTISPECIES: hypothetical protein [Pseudomonas]|uniref:hypothetical protein n=1 Tax=Pseudomonas TaxID=286 RepID=UPI001B57E9DD|nr:MULTISPECIES: hypothetical protein [unclassified Pseudomonas]MBP1126299.1 hypothetical protein [Pseudomonas sp. PvP025]MDQ0400158.1 hypothetical protein [Pseudomonas sp. PvP006]